MIYNVFERSIVIFRLLISYGKKNTSMATVVFLFFFLKQVLVIEVNKFLMIICSLLLKILLISPTNIAHNNLLQADSQFLLAKSIAAIGYLR